MAFQGFYFVHFEFKDPVYYLFLFFFTRKLFSVVLGRSQRALSQTRCYRIQVSDYSAVFFFFCVKQEMEESAGLLSPKIIWQAKIIMEESAGLLENEKVF